MKNTIIASILFSGLLSLSDQVKGQISNTFTLDSLGACQGISRQNGKYFLYGDREVGVMREYKLGPDTLIDEHQEYRFTIDGKNIIKHPTGIAYRKGLPTIVGNSVRQNAEGTIWKALLYSINWDGFLKTKTLDGNLIQTIEDDACIQGSRPEYVPYKGKWYVATADYGDKQNQVRLYDPEALRTAAKTSEKGVLYKTFKCGPWVQNLHWDAENGKLILVQNQIEGRKWKLTWLDLDKSIESGKEVILNVVTPDPQDELEGFTFTNDSKKGIAVTSSKKNNISFLKL